ncbi:MAG: neutral/alkaline non-lysosomal ceramidase N-terminal domain-containing protein [Dehalococcoidia bacterium]
MAGATAKSLTPPPGLPMGGYGARQGTATGTHDDLMVRTLCLSDGDKEVAIAVCDFVGVPDHFVRRVRQRIEGELGIPAAAVCVAATHTHSGPSVVYSHRLDDYLERSANTVMQAIAKARTDAVPAVLKLATVPLDSIAQNRRDPAGRLQHEAHLLLAENEDTGMPIATLVNYACHATVLEHDNMEYSADFPGAACAFVERNVGGVGIYLQGCCGDVNPVWMAHDFNDVDRVGGIVGAAATRAVQEMRPLGRGQWGINLSWSEEIPEPPITGRVLEMASLGFAVRRVELRQRDLAPLDDIVEEIEKLEKSLAELPADDQKGRRPLLPRINQLAMERLQQTYHQLRAPERREVEVQVFRLSANCALVALPGEFLVATRESLERDAPVERLLVCGYANDYIGYVPPLEEFPNGGYEVGFARFAEDSEKLVRDAALDALRELYEER